MTGLLRRYFSYPALPGEEATLRARTFHRVALGFLVIAGSFLLVLGAMEPTAMNRRLVNLTLLALWCCRWSNSTIVATPAWRARCW